jgi:hypothetical protein
MGAALVAKQQDGPTAPQPASGGKVTTWKCNEHIAKILRKIQAYVGSNQEGVLDLFEAELDNYLATLQAKDMAERKKRSGQ